MENFTPFHSLIGGVLIGTAATAMLALLGRVAGVSGIVGGLLTGERSELGWRGGFVGGLLFVGAILGWYAPDAFTMSLDRSTFALVLAGLLVGFGARLGSGCTSGHGVCGIARGSGRSSAATLTFMLTGGLTALIVTQMFGGRV